MAPHEEVAELDLDPAQWEVVIEEVRSREAIGPDADQKAMAKDGVVGGVAGAATALASAFAHCA